MADTALITIIINNDEAGKLEYIKNKPDALLAWDIDGIEHIQRESSGTGTQAGGESR